MTNIRLVQSYLSFIVHIHLPWQTYTPLSYRTKLIFHGRNSPFMAYIRLPQQTIAFHNTYLPSMTDIFEFHGERMDL